MWFFRMCRGGLGCSSGGGGGGGCALCSRVLVGMFWLYILYSFFKMFGAVCVKHMSGHWL